MLYDDLFYDIIFKGEKMKNKLTIKVILDYILIILLLILSLSKAGFYKSDILIFSVVLSIIGFIRIAVDLFTTIKTKSYKFDIIETLLLLLSLTYILPILFKNYADLNSSIFESIRYFNLFLVYYIVKRTENPKLFINTIIGIALIQCVLSIDMVGNRYLENILKSIGSGYLDRDFNRMSGTIQYANTLAILCLISIVMLYEKIIKENNIYKFILLYVSIFTLFSTLVLTGTRSVLILLIISFIFLMFKNKNEITKNLVIYIPLVIFTLIYSAIAYSNMMTFNVYYIFLVSLVVSALLGFVTYKLLSLKINLKSISNRKVLIFTVIFMVIYCILAFNISKPLYLNNKDSESLIINKLQENNEIKITVNSLEDDSRYRLVINSVSNDNVEENISSFNYSDNTSGIFKSNFNLSKDIKYIKMYIYCDKGNIKVESIRLNDKNIKTDYVLIPRTLVYRFEDLIKGSTSSSDRITYYKDAFKIIGKTLPNFVIGTGGEGFNNMYKMVQTVKYTSTEVHSSFIQIFVESGILGFLVMLVILIYTIFKSKNSYIKFAYILFVIHSLIDLNFSYMFMICIFGILIACMEYTNEKKENNNIYLYIITIIMALTLTIISFIFSFKALLAQYVKIRVYNEENITLDKRIEVVCQNEKRVMLDPYEYNYRKKLNEEYEKYFELLDEKIKDNENKDIIQEEAKNVLLNIKQNADEILKNNKYNSSEIMYACNIYFKNIKNFAKAQNNDGIESNINKYMKLINNNLNRLKLFYKTNSEVIKEIEDVQNKCNKED